MVFSLVSSLARDLAYNENKLYKNLDYWSRDMFNFNFLEKGLGIASRAYFVFDFSRKYFLKLCSINWPNFIVWLPLLLELLVNMRIAIVFFPCCDVINFEIHLSNQAVFVHDQKVNTKIQISW